MNVDEVVQARWASLPQWLDRGRHIFLLAAFMIGGALILASDAWLPSRTKVALQAGQVAPRDILAPRSLKYESEELSKAKREAQVAAVRPIYDPPDPAVKNEQLQRAREILDFIENVRYDDLASSTQKQTDLTEITDLSLDAPVAVSLLSLEDDSRWRAIDAQVMRLLERVMGGEVRDDTIQAERDSLPDLISASYSETEVEIIIAIVEDLIRPNAFYNAELTRQAELEAAENVPVEVRTFARGQMIIREGEIATPAHIEALERFDLLRQTQHRFERLFGGLLAMSLVTLVQSLYIRKFHPRLFEDSSFMVVLAALFLLFVAGTQLVDTNQPAQPYYFPAAALAFLIATLVEAQLGIVVLMTLAALAGFGSNNSLEFTILIGASGTLGILALGRPERLNAYFVAGGIVSLSGVGVALVFALGTDDPPSLFTIVSQIFGSLINGFFSAAVAFVGLYVISNILNIPTSLKIVELQQPNHALLQRLLREAPGTYQHSLQVANLAELGAQQVDANASLLRVAAMYHDVGKILNPHFFVENQADGVNPHTILDDPHQSARIIIGHVPEGERLARRYHLPNRIRDFIVEHHGTTQVAYFYLEALKRVSHATAEVNPADFTYPGPRPQSRETAILMLADGCESSVRARRPQNKEDIRETVDYIFESRLESGQLDESGLTLNDLRSLRDTFLAALQGVFHPRIAYPGTPGQLPAAPPASLPPTTAASQLAAGAAGKPPAVRDPRRTARAMDSIGRGPQATSEETKVADKDKSSERAPDKSKLSGPDSISG